MSENPIAISTLNDFIFCPVSIYFHTLDEEENILSQDIAQINGSHSHRNSDLAVYSTKKSILQGISVYCEEYGLCGKIDVFDTEKSILTERKKKIKAIYDGYVFQMYAQYFALTEMGYDVKKLKLYSMDTNKGYDIDLPEKNQEMSEKFTKLITDMKNFSFDNFKQSNEEKCNNCIYEPLCCFSIKKGDGGAVYHT